MEDKKEDVLSAARSTGNSAESYKSTITDTLNDVLGGDGPGFAGITLDTKFSERMTSFFRSTRVIVYEYSSKLCRVITYPGVNEYAQPNYVRAKVLSTGEYVSDHISNFQNAERRGTFWNTIMKQGGFSKLTFDPSSRKFSINLDTITIYISSAFKRLLTPDEIVAVLLHEVGANIMLGRDVMINSIVGLFYPVAILLWNIYIFFFLKDGFELSESAFFSRFIFSIAALLGIIFFLAFVCVFLKRKSEMYKDEFTIKCGYGKELESAIKKYHAYLYDYGAEEKRRLNDGFNSLDSVMQGWDRIGHKLQNILSWLKLNRYQERSEREKMIHDKTEKYDASDNNLDRSSHI